MPRLRQAVLAARDLEAAIAALREELNGALGEPYHDPGVAWFGLVNAVFAIGDTFLEIVSPADVSQPGAQTAARQLERSGAAVCGYMAMVQVDDLAAARARAAAAGVREVFALDLDDIEEVHLHPADMRGAIVALSRPRPAESWRWGGPDWPARSAPGRVAGVTVASAESEAVATRWAHLAGGEIPGCRFTTPRPADGAPGGAVGGAAGIVAVELELDGKRHTLVPARLGGG